MDDILQTIKREVTIDGVEGSTLSRVWDYADLGQQRLLEKNGVSSETASADSALRAYLWPHITRISSLIFLNRDKIILDNTDPKSADSKEARKFLNCDFSKLEKEYPELVVRASRSAIYKVIFGREEGIDRVINSPGAMKFLMCLLRAREKGVTQARLAKDNQFDPRSAFHFLKLLDSYGLTVKHRTFSEGCNTNLLILRIFTSEANETGNICKAVPPAHAKGSDKSEDENAMDIDEPRGATTDPRGEIAKLVQSGLRRRISELLESTDSGYMFETDLIDGVGLDIWKGSHIRYYHRVIGALSRRGYIELVRIQAPDPSLHYESSGSVSDPEEDACNQGQVAAFKRNLLRSKIGVCKKKKGGLPQGHSYRRCVRFIKPYVSSNRVRASIGIPKRAKQKEHISAFQEDLTSETNQLNPSADEDEDGDIMDSSDDDIVDVDAVKEKDDIKHMLSRPQVQIGVLASMPLEMQVFRLIALAGTHGTVAKAIWFILKDVGYRIIDRAVNHLETTPVFTQDGGVPGIIISEEEKAQNLTRLNEMLVVRIDEFVGREHRRRFFANPLAQPLISRLIVDYTQDVGVDSSIVDIPDKDADAELVGNPDDGTESVAGFERVEDAADSVGGDAANQQNELHSASSITELDERFLDECGDIEDVIAEAKERKVSFNWVIRERVILRFLEHEHYFVCTKHTAIRFGDMIGRYFQGQLDSPALTSTMIASAKKYVMDKRTLIRAVKSLDGDNKLWYRTVDMSTTNISSRESNIARIAIARSLDPSGPLIKSFINQLGDMRPNPLPMSVTMPRNIQDDIVIQRPEGAEARDKEIVKRLRKYDGFQIQNEGSAANSRKRPSTIFNFMLAKRARVMLKTSKAEFDADSDWANVHKRLKQPPFRIGRMADLLGYLVENLPQHVDDKFVYQNYVFRTSFIFSCLPLELYTELGGGVMSMPLLLPYIKDGIVPADDGEDVDMDGVHQEGQSTIEDVNRRLATPINQLPKSLRKMLNDLLSKTRMRIQPILFGLQVLQLIQPIHSSKDIICMPEPPDARDAFCNVRTDNPRVLSFGYQLVGKARLLTTAGYSVLVDACEQNVEGPIDLTGYYLNDEVYDLLTPMGLFKYLSDLEISAREISTEFSYGHPLYGIGNTRHWRRPVILRASQTALLDKYIDPTKAETPLGDMAKLKEASAVAETTLEETRRYFQHSYVKMLRAAARRASYKKRVERIRAKVREARVATVKNHETMLKGRKETGKSHKKRQVWTDEDTQRLAIYYAVMILHARQHGHPFIMTNILSVFPNREHTVNPSQALRQHQSRSRKDPQIRALGDGINMVWKYVLRDAVIKGELTDEPDIDLFDPKPQVDYFADLLKETSLGTLVHKYTDDLTAEGESNYLTSVTGISDLTRIYPGRQRQDRALQRPILFTGFRTSKNRLPATMKGIEDQYTINYINARNRNPVSPEFGEDSYSTGVLNSRNQKTNVYGTMLTTHSGYRCMVDYSNPITTKLSMPSGPNDNVESEESEMLHNSEIVTQDSGVPSYPDMMRSMRPLERSFDAMVLAEKVEALAQDESDNEMDTVVSDDDSASERTTLCCGESDYNSAKNYAELANLQAAIMNLTLTPQDEYSVKTGHQLLSLKEDASTKALNTLYRHSAITRLRGMASSIGLGTASSHDKSNVEATLSQDSTDKDEAIKPANSVSELRHEVRNTVLVHGNTGTTRMNVKSTAAVSSTPLQLDEPVADGDNSNNVLDEGENTNTERRVPGRGFTASEKFLGVIYTLLPDTFLDPDLSKLHEGAELNDYLEPAEFGYMCSLIGESKLWLRPSYDALSCKQMHALAGFKRMEDYDIADFAVNVIANFDGAPMDDVCGTSAVDTTHLEEATVAQIGLSDKPLTKVIRLVLGIVSAMGPLGASAYELARVFAVLSKGNTKGSFIKLPQEMQSTLHSEKRVGILLSLLAQQEKVYMVGSNDVRFVSAKMYHKHWTLSLDDSDIVFVPRLGQNLSGSVNRTFTIGMLTALLGHIVSNPGISQVTIMRRYFAPYISKFEVMHYLNVLLNLGIIFAETDVDPNIVLSGAPYSLELTYYYMTSDYYQKLGRLTQCSALSDLHVLQ
ncbi:hypothetical protein H4S08_001949 [Coemansia sp. RSA 1365]|nr:hypothetical protein H4S08_001949 [Coemansia sp. RSA 1365]